MKKFTLVFTVLCFSLIIYGENEYHKFSGTGALWNTITTGKMSYPYELQSKQTLGDTVVFEGVKYLEVINNDGDWYQGTAGGIREDTITKKIYYYSYNQEVVLYDFSLNIGDTIFYRRESGYPESVYFKVVDSISSINLNGEHRKIWYLTTSMHSMKDIWIEGIGSVFRLGLINPLAPEIPTNGSTTYFGCYKYKDILYFNREVTNSEDCPCSQWTVSVPEVIGESTEIKLYPIPTKEKLTIHFGNTIYDSFEIYTYNSKLIEKTNINLSESIELNLENLEKGIYFIKFSGKNGVYLKKFVKL